MKFSYKNPLILALLFFLPGISLEAHKIDLNALDAYVRSGFEKEWAMNPPPTTDKDWLLLPARPGGKRNIAIRDLDLPGKPKRFFLDPRPQTMMDFTILFNFGIPGPHILEESYAIFLGGIGERWEIYFNGKLLATDQVIYSGEKRTGYFYKGLLLPVPGRFLKSGTNQLVLKIRGEPNFKHTGLYYKLDYIVGPYHELKDLVSERSKLVFAFIYLFFGIYHFIMFLSRKDQVYNLYFSLAAILIFVYLFMYSYSIYEFIPNGRLIRKIELASLFCALPLVLAFFNSLFSNHLNMYVRSFAVISGFFILGIVFGSMSLTDNITTLWQIAALLIAAFTFYYLITFFRKRVQEAMIIRAHMSIAPRIGASLYNAIIKTTSGNLLFGTALTMFSAIYDIFGSVFYPTSFRLTTYGFFLLVAGISIAIANRMTRLHKKVLFLNDDLMQKVSDLNEANLKFSRNEKQFRMLVEGSDDIILNLDQSGMILNYSYNILHRLKYPENLLKTMNFMDLLTYDTDTKTASFTRKIISENMNLLLKTREPVSFPARFSVHGMNEDIELNIRMEIIQSKDRKEIVARASNIIQDSTLSNLVNESKSYVIGNSLLKIDEISRRLIRNLKRYTTEDTTIELRLALRECLINAVEHGNLNIDFEEKSRIIETENYLDFISLRIQSPEFRNKKVFIEYELTPEHVRYTITDQGNGFDHKSFRNKTPAEMNYEYRLHGRGIFMTENAFDTVEFNEKGNRVILMKYF